MEYFYVSNETILYFYNPKGFSQTHSERVSMNDNQRIFCLGES